MSQWRDAFKFDFHKVNYHPPSISWKAVGLCVFLN
jgi:hypothetical protein